MKGVFEENKMLFFESHQPEVEMKALADWLQLKEG